MGFLTGAKFAASSFLSSWTKDGEVSVASENNTSSKHASLHLRGEAKRTWTLRKREFDKLRALRQSEVINDDKPKQRFFHTSMLTDLSEKTSTIKKIDEIEAQMSMQWWKTDRLDYSSREMSKIPQLSIDKHSS
jgi:hypothetical protein